MNKEEIKEVLEIIRQPIIVNCQDYHYFDQENYNKLVSVYDNCQWFINNYEQLMINLEDLQQKVNQLETNRDELKKWLRVCLEENNKIRLYDNNSYQAGEINTLENVIDKMQELERDKE